LTMPGASRDPGPTCCATYLQRQRIVDRRFVGLP
jgi:hypothetical protein